MTFKNYCETPPRRRGNLPNRHSVQAKRDEEPAAHLIRGNPVSLYFCYCDESTKVDEEALYLLQSEFFLALILKNCIIPKT